MKKINFKILLTLVSIVFYSAFANAQYFTEDFENDLSQWTISGDAWEIGNGTVDGPGNVAEGDSCAYHPEGDMFGDTRGSMISPSFNLTGATNPSLTFKYYLTDGGFGSNDTLDVYISTDGASFTLVSSIFTSVTEWSDASIDLSSYNGQSSVQIKFDAKNAGNGSSINIDDIKVGEAASCPAPTALSVSGITTTGATLSWTAGGSETAWVVEYGTEGFTVGSGTTVNAAATTVDLTGLTPDQKYDVYVKADCGGGDLSDNVGPKTFKTAGPGDVCSDPIELTFPADFTSGVYEDIAQTTTDRGNSTDTTCLFTQDEGNDIFYKMTLTEAMNITLTVDPKTSKYVGVLISSDCPDSTNCIVHEGIGGTPTPIVLTHDFSAGTYYIMVDKFNLDVDDIPDFDLKIETVTCPKPTDLGAGNFTTTSAELSWTTGGASSWNVLVVTQGTDTTGLSEAAPEVTSNPLTVDTLIAGTAYEFYVRDICAADDKSSWVGPFTFATTADCTPITAYPYTESFENVLLPVCWSKNIPTGNPNDITIVNTDAYEGSYSVKFSSELTSSTSYIQDLLSPTFTINASFPQLTFWTGKFHESYMPDSIAFGIATATDTTWHGAETGTAGAPGTWYKTELNLASYAGQDIIIIFRLIAEDSYYNINLDDVNIGLLDNVSNIENNIDVKVYPNPNNGNFTVNAYLKEKQDVNVSVIDMFGKVIYTSKLDNINEIHQNIQVNNIAKGVYFVRLSSKDSIYQEKIVIK